MKRLHSRLDIPPVSQIPSFIHLSQNGDQGSSLAYFQSAISCILCIFFSFILERDNNRIIYIKITWASCCKAALVIIYYHYRLFYTVTEDETYQQQGRRDVKDHNSNSERTRVQAKGEKEAPLIVFFLSETPARLEKASWLAHPHSINKTRPSHGGEGG